MLQFKKISELVEKVPSVAVQPEFTPASERELIERERGSLVDVSAIRITPKELGQILGEEETLIAEMSDIFDASVLQKSSRHEPSFRRFCRFLAELFVVANRLDYPVINLDDYQKVYEKSQGGTDWGPYGVFLPAAERRGLIRTEPRPSFGANICITESGRRLVAIAKESE